MAEKITELYIALESRMNRLHETRKIPDRFYNTYTCVCKENNKCIHEQSVFHKFMMGIRPENVTSAKELPDEFLKILDKYYPHLAQAEIAGADLANMIVCAYNTCCQYGKALSNRLSQLYRQASINDKQMAETLEEFEEQLRLMSQSTANNEPTD